MGVTCRGVCGALSTPLACGDIGYIVTTREVGKKCGDRRTVSHRLASGPLKFQKEIIKTNVIKIRSPNDLQISEKTAVFVLDTVAV
jgi:hypothetical protein